MCPLAYGKALVTRIRRAGVWGVVVVMARGTVRVEG